MTRPLDPHEPTPEFRAHLEWQLETALRRESRLTAPVVRRHPLRVAVLVVLALAAGGAAGVAAGHVQDARQRSSLTESVMAEVQLVQTRLELAQAEYQDVRRRYETGTAGRESLAEAQQQVRELEAALQRLHLDLEEIRITASAPRNELSAPRVNQRDFVRDRLLLNLQTTQRALATAEERLKQLRERIEVGTAPRVALGEAELRRVEAESQMLLLQTQLELRKRFLEQDLQAQELTAELRRTELTLGYQLAQRELALAQDRLKQLRDQAAVGLAAELEVKRAEVTLLERQLALQRLRKELDTLRSRVK